MAKQYVKIIYIRLGKQAKEFYKTPIAKEAFEGIKGISMTKLFLSRLLWLMGYSVTRNQFGRKMKIERHD